MLANATQSILDAYRVARQVLVAVVVSLVMVLNVAAGTFSGIRHAHEHEHSASDHHDNDHSEALAESVSDANDTPIQSSPSGYLPDQTHEHSPELVLGLPQLLSCAFSRCQSSLVPARPAAEFRHTLGPSDRPPRLA